VTSYVRDYILKSKGAFYSTGKERKVNSTLDNDKNVVKDDYFMLAIRNWDDKLEDFLAVDDPTTAIHMFNAYADAESTYFSMNYQNCPKAEGKDVKVELIHMRFGLPHIIRNQIFFP
jgi:hypothetical protein